MVAAALAVASAAAAGCSGGSGDGTGETNGDLCSPMDPVPRRLWRLSTQQFSNSVRDLLGMSQGPVLNTLGGGSQFAFFSDDTVSVNPTLAFAINGAVQTSLASVAANIPAMAACQAGEAEGDCAKRFATDFGMRAFRRPLDGDEVTALLQVYTAGRTTDFNTGISLMMQALMQSPSFLFRSELGGAVNPSTGATALGPYEVATQLSYTFLNSTPDQPLLAAAGDGSLATAAGISKQVDRLLATSTAQQNVDSVVLSWFNVPQLAIKAKDPALFPAVLPSLVPSGQDVQSVLQADLMTSTADFVDDVVWKGSGKVADLLTSQKVFVNQRLSALYGLPYDSASALPDGFAAATDPMPRAGMISQPGFIWSLSDPASTSIVHRGKAVHDYVVCGNALPPPPAGLLSSDAVIKLLAMLPTELDKANYRIAHQPCQTCHLNIDTYGLLFEGLDPVGNHRTMYAAADMDPDPITQSADFSMAPDAAPLTGVITGPVEFAQAIIANQELANCAAMMMSSYALGRYTVATIPDPNDMTNNITVNNTCEVNKVRAQFKASDGKLSTLLRQVATASFLQTRVGGSP
jgi:Protein of unknown function (DUF1592)/Protein of unknown function (DUF1595)/Protein of unknown function (DUF1588)